MMRFFLLLSLILNIILVYYVIKKPEKEVIERLIIETHPKNDGKNKQDDKSQSIPDSRLNKKEKKKNTPNLSDFEMMGHEEFQEAGEKMESDRLEFFTESLGVSEEKLAQHDRLRKEFFQQSSKYWQKNPMKELSFKERKELLELEEKYLTQLEKLYGKKNWEKYQNFRQKYNQEGYKKQLEEGRPFIYMGL